MNRSIQLIVLVVVWALGFMQTAVYAQSEAESASGGLVLSSQKEGIETTVKVGRTIHVKYTTDRRTFPNKQLNGVTPTQVVLSGDTIGIDYIQSVSLRDEHKYSSGRKVLLASLIVTLAFYLVTLLGVGLLFGNAALGVVFLVLAIILAIPASVAMPAGLIIGLVLMAKASKTYDRARGWKIATQAAPPASPKANED